MKIWVTSAGKGSGAAEVLAEIRTGQWKKTPTTALRPLTEVRAVEALQTFSLLVIYLRLLAYTPHFILLFPIYFYDLFEVCITVKSLGNRYSTGP